MAEVERQEKGFCFVFQALFVLQVFWIFLFHWDLARLVGSLAGLSGPLFIYESFVNTVLIDT